MNRHERKQRAAKRYRLCKTTAGITDNNDLKDLSKQIFDHYEKVTIQSKYQCICNQDI